MHTASRESVTWSKYTADLRLSLVQGFSSTRDAWRRVWLRDSKPQGEYMYCCNDDTCLPVHEGKTLGDYRDSGETPLSEGVLLSRLGGRAPARHSVPYYRLAQRRIASSTNERTSIFCILPPGCVCLEKVRIETQPCERPSAVALFTIAISNSYTYDWLSRLRVATTVSQFLVDEIPVCKIGDELLRRLLAHTALRLTCNHRGYEPLWHEQLGDVWREPGKPPFTWPTLATDDERWHVRAAIDAVVADAYGLSRDQYAHVLSTFKHTSYPKAPELCLARFDELKSIGLDAFTKKHDPYWDIPLNENLPQPVIELPGLHCASIDKFALEATSKSGRTRTRKKP